MMALLFQLEQSQWLAPEELWNRQRLQLASLLQHAASSVPYYRETLAQWLPDLRNAFTAADFRTLPTTDRNILQQQFKALTSARVPQSHGACREGQTSGSTGAPARYLSTDLSSFFWHAFNLRDHVWHKRDALGHLMVIRARDQPAQKYSNWFAETGMEAFATGPMTVVSARLSMQQQWEALLREEPDYLLATGTILAELARLTIERGAPPGRLKEVRSFGEPVDDELRRLCREAWGVRLTDVYSTRETGYLALQCPEADHYHVQSEGAFIEIVDDAGKACLPGRIGRVVVTPLHNFAMPLIRYDLGDFAEAGGGCRCGRGLPVLGKIAGRVRNILVLPNGEKYWPMLGTEKYRGVAPVKMAQIVQISLQEVQMRLVVERPLHADEERQLAGILTASLGHPFAVSFAYSESLPRTPDGKFEDFVSMVPHGGNGLR